MAVELTSENSYNLMPFLVLLIALLLMMILLRTRKKMKRRIAVAFSLTTTCIAALTVMNLFSEYTIDVMHVLSHVMFSAILLLCAKLLVTERVPAFLHLFIILELNIFDRFQYTLAQTIMCLFNRIRDLLELNIFDRFQYTLAQTIMCLASNIRRTQTGNLNFNMIGVMIGFIICLLLPLLLGFICF